MLSISIRISLVAAAAGLSVSLVNSGKVAAADDLAVTSTIVYDVQTSDVPVRVTWDVSITDNDPETQPSGSGVLVFYDTVNLPVIRGATGVAVTDEAGRLLTWSLSDPGRGVAESIAIGLSDPLFYGESAKLRIVYTVPPERTEGILVTPNYAYIPVITAGDESTVVVNTPVGNGWETTLEASECPAASANSFNCSGGGDGAYVAATVETVKPGAVARTIFVVEMEKEPLQIELAYLQGEDAAATHQRELLTAALPLIEEIYGVAYDGPPAVTVAHGGRQSVLGYEGLATCSATGCVLVVSPVADDYTVLHEATHLWSDLYTKRWLAEGFAELVSHEAIPLLPPGLFQGGIPVRRASGANLQLDDWGDAGSIIGADPEEVAVIEAGYDYSLRFLESLRSTYGLDMLRAVNRSIVATGPSDSRKFMDLVEQSTQETLDSDFLLWVFPDSYRAILEQRRQANTRLAALRATLAEEGLPDTALVSIQQQVAGWSFSDALVGIEQLETNLNTYIELSSQLESLETDSEAAGLVLSSEVADALNRFDFTAATNLIASSRRALDLYIEAQEEVDADRNIWAEFGLLGSDPEDELQKAAQAFEDGQFTESAEQSEEAINLVSDAQQQAMQRVLIVGGFLLVMAICVGLAVAIGRWRYHVAHV